MPTLRFTIDAPIPPATLVAALTDFTADRPKRWRNLDPTLYKVHATGDTWAEVTEGSRMGGVFWERMRYDWSEPGVVKTTLLESNTFAPGSFWEYRITPAGQGGSHVECTVRRIGKGLKGRLVAALVGLGGKRVLRRDLELMLGQLAATPR